MKNQRHEKILELIDLHQIDTQEELLSWLEKEGFHVTQATVSRDIRELQLVKTATGDGGYRYVASFGRDKTLHTTSRFETIFRESVIKVDSAGNIVLVQCFSGMANAACELFDTMVWNNVVGTLAGDDTFLVLTRSEEAAVELCDILHQYINRK